MQRGLLVVARPGWKATIDKGHHKAKRFERILIIHEQDGAFAMAMTPMSSWYTS